MSLKYSLTFLFLLTILFQLTTGRVFAQTETPIASPACKPIFGGGEFTCEHQTTSTPTPTKSAPTATPSPKQQTKGGLPVEKQSKAKSTPATGPEIWTLIGLIPAAGIGLWLRRKTRN